MGDSTLDLSTYRDNLYTQNNNVFALNHCNNKNQKYINIKKGIYDQDLYLQYPSDSIFHDDRPLCKNRSQPQYSLENLPSPYPDRQRNSFLRDVFAETYPRNGNANGLTAGVLAISNEHYRDPTSVLLTNVNGKHPRNTNALSEISRVADSDDYAARERKLAIENRYLNEDVNVHPIPGPLCFPNHTTNYYQNEVLTQSIVRKTWTNSLTLGNPKDLLPLELQRRHPISSHHSSTEPLAIFCKSSEMESKAKNLESPSILALSVQKTANNTIMEKNFTENNRRDENVFTEPPNNLSKTTIFNHVLENPWSPRLPKTYRQFINKIQSTCIIDNKEDKKDAIINDANNNIQLPATSSDETETNNSNDSNDLKCSVCSQVFTNSESLNEHVRRHSAGRYACGECGKTFSQLRNFKYHMSVHRGTREFAATCTVCGKYFNDRGYLSSHMKIHRNRKEYKCSICPKSFNQRVAYNMHVRIHTGVKPHVCEQCGKAFSRKMLLKQHQRTHSGERPYACPHCDKRFADRSNMTLHLRLHTGVKPFSCTLCPKSFTKKHHLKSHLNFHTGAKPYPCPRCKLAFTQSSNMRTHLKKCNAPEAL